MKNKFYRKCAELLSSSLFGISLEFFVVHFYESYHYSANFIFQLDSAPNNVPIVIGLCWGMIIFTSMKISDIYNFPLWSRPLFDGLLALTIDLSMDAIAIRLEGGFWTWNLPLINNMTNESFFGVPYGNFTGWFLIVLTYSSVIRISRLIWKEEKLTISSSIYFLIMPIFSYLLFILSNGIFWTIISLFWHTIGFRSDNLAFGAVIITLLVSGLINLFFYLNLSEKIPKNFDVQSSLLFLSFHCFFLISYLWLNLIQVIPIVFLVGIINLLIDLLIHIRITDFKLVNKRLRTIY
ncbi:MAG: carotenoid biosynthesis protein [Candidatus Thorarchaeota archaeon]